MAKSIRTLEATVGLVAALEVRAPNCYLCRWILEDVKAAGKLTGYPADYTGQPQFPVSGKIRHLELEGFIPELDGAPKSC